MAEEPVVHIVDDDAAVRQSLSFLLASDGLPVRLHESAVAFLEKVGVGGSGCVVTDVRMPEIDGVEFMRRLRQSGYAMPVIVITGHADVPLAVEAMKQGALDFVEKPFDDETILGAVRLALSRHRERFRIDNETQEIRQRLQSLSERERQVLDGLVAGKANKVIAFELDISPRTVEIYRANVMTKMQARSLSELVRFVLLARAKGDKP